MRSPVYLLFVLLAAGVDLLPRTAQPGVVRMPTASGSAPGISNKLRGTDRFAKVHIIKDGQYADGIDPKKPDVDLVWVDNTAVEGTTGHCYVRGEPFTCTSTWARKSSGAA